MSLWIHGLGVLAPMLFGCGSGGPPGVPDEQATSLSLQVLETVELEIPSDSRGGVEPPAGVSLDKPWKYAGKTGAGMHKWSTPIPIRPRGLFFHQPEPGISLTTADGQQIPYGRFGFKEQPYWSHNRKVVIVYRPEKGAPPGAGDFTLSYPKAVERERAMNQSMSGIAITNDFVRAQIHHDWNTRQGLLLPAPARIAWQLEIPAAAELLMAPGLAEPEIADGPASDGATLNVIVEEGGVETIADSRMLQPGEFPQTKVDLSAWAGKTVKLTFRVDPGDTSNFDYAFIGEPIVASRKTNPKRVVLVFIDTLRADHLGMYGYDRETSTNLDSWAKGAAVFDNARSVAPWTLPSARAVTTGRHPELYAKTPSLQKTLSDEGFATAMFAGNVYLSTNFEMARDWGHHRVGMWPRAKVITDDALAYLDAYEGHDALILVHYMDPHLPYLEPRDYRMMFAGQSQGGLGEEFHLPDVRAVNGRQPAVRQYVIDRYDNNVRYATDQAARLLGKMSDDDVVVVFADHGEEFWDHGGFEHGHQLFDELLHVPLIVKAPGVTGIHVTEPASLLDVTPTVLDALGLDVGERDGISLLAAARGQSGPPELGNRTLSFGRPLYGTERWGALTTDNHKWMTHQGDEQAYDLNDDPLERNNLLRGPNKPDPSRYYEALGDAFAPAGVGFRLVASGARSATEHDLIVAMHVPGGVETAWVENDPLGVAAAKVTVLPPKEGEDGYDTVVASWGKTNRGLATVWVIPKEPLLEVAPDVRLETRYGAQVDVLSIPATKKITQRDKNLLISSNFQGRSVQLGFGVSPIPTEDMKGVSGMDEEMRAELEAAGYLHREEDEPKPEE